MMPSARCSPMAVRGMGACRQGVHVCVTIISFDLVPWSLSDRMSLATQTAAAIACARKKCTAISLGTGKQSASHGHPVCWTLNEQSEQLPRPPRSSEHVLGAARGYHQQPEQPARGQAIEAPTRHIARSLQTPLPQRGVQSDCRSDAHTHHLCCLCHPCTPVQHLRTTDVLAAHSVVEKSSVERAHRALSLDVQCLPRHARRVRARARGAFTQLQGFFTAGLPAPRAGLASQGDSPADPQRESAHRCRTPA